MIGQEIHHYKIIEKISDGGIGVVYKAEDTKLDRIVAIKFLPHKITINSNERERFIIEAKAAATLNHSNVATIYGIEEFEDELFIVMEFIEGQDLRKILGNADNKQGAYFLPIEKILHYTIQIVQGLQAAHEKLIVHRDIKPENIMITAKDQVKIMDFGLAKMPGSELLTKIGTTMGTVAYMSPEQTKGESVKQNTDIWSLGIIMYEMIAGYRPFRGHYEQAIMYSILNENPEPLQLHRPDIPQKLEKIVNRALAKSPADRYQNCEQLLNDLQSFTQSVEQVYVSQIKTGVKEPETFEDDFKPSQRRVAGYMKRIVRQLRITWKIVIATLVLVAISIYFFLQTSQPDDTDSKKIAVLPFTNMNDDPADEYFSDGITEDILTQLVKIGGLKVISRTTMMRYKSSNKTLGEIAKELNTDVVLEGSVRYDSSQVRISVQLIDANKDEHLWAETYDKEFNKVFVIQSEIAQKIAEALHTTLSPKEKKQIEKVISSNSNAYNLFLQGRYFYARGTREDVSKAIDKFLEAISIDPNDARVWAALATAYMRQADKGSLNPDEGYAKARWAAENSLSLDNNCGWGHVVLGLILAFYDWDMIAAASEFRKALALEPGNVTIIGNMAHLARVLGRFDEAIALLKKAIDLEPITVTGYTNLGHCLMYTNRLEEAVVAYENAIELNPQYPAAHTFLGLVYLLQGKTDRAIYEIEQESDEGWRIYGLALAYYGVGLKKDADTTLTYLITNYQYESAFQIAEVYAFRNEIDLAFEWLEKAYTLRDVGLTVMKGDPFLKNIEEDPRYAVFMKKAKLPI
jgi:serine/threonine protein kinase